MSFRSWRAFSVAAWIVLGAPILTAQSDHIFKGEVCVGAAGQSPIVADGQVVPKCTGARAKRGAHYLLFNPKNKAVYELAGQKKPKAFTGQNVLVVGTLDQTHRTIYADHIFRALPPAVTRGKSAYIDCDACERGMAAAWLAAFEQLTAWGRFDIVPDPRKADLIFLLSANPYLGDFLTRDGPDKRPVRVDITYLDVVDPRTGASWWDDSKQWGSLLVARATKDLIDEFKEQLELEEHAGKD
jgi:hypothetical protein